MRRSSVGQSESGFTLIEILAAIFIFAMVITALMSTYRAVFTHVEHIDQSLEQYNMAANCLKRINADLQSVFVSLPPTFKAPGLDSPPDPYRFAGATADVAGNSFALLRFTSLSHLSFGEAGRKGITAIVYYVEADGEDNYVLKRADRLYPFEEPFEAQARDPILCSRLKVFNISYYDETDEAYETWNSDEHEFGYATPRAVEVTLEIGDEMQSLPYHCRVTLPVVREKIE